MGMRLVIGGGFLGLMVFALSSETRRPEGYPAGGTGAENSTASVVVEAGTSATGDPLAGLMGSCGERTFAWRELFASWNQQVSGNQLLAPPQLGGWFMDPAAGYIPPIACVEPGTDPEVVGRINDLFWSQVGPLAYLIGTRWSGAQGSPRALTWSFAPDGIIIPSGIGELAANNEIFARMDALFGGNRALWISRFEQSFERWAELTGTSYTRVTDGVNDWDDGAGWGASGSATRGDIRIGMKPIDGGFNVLAYNSFPSGGGDMVLDRAESWGDASNSHRRLRNVAMHEHGHGLGVFHVCPLAGARLMEPNLALGFDGPQHDDLRAVQRHYGDPFEEDNTSATATDLGLLIAGNTVVVGDIPSPAIPTSALLSIDADGEQDFFRFTISGPRDVEIVVTPFGLNYDSSPQVGQNCTSGNFVNSLSIANLAVELLDTDGVSVLASAMVQPAGNPETLVHGLPVAGDYFIRVFETNTPQESQLYSLEVTSDTCVVDLDCNDGVFCNGEETCSLGNCQAGSSPCPGLICMEASDRCVPNPPDFDPTGQIRNRYLSFVANNSGSVGFRVEMTGSDLFPVAGVVGWVGAPVLSGCPPHCPGEFVAPLVDEAGAHFSNAWPSPLVVTGCAIVPATDYSIQAIAEGEDPGDPLNFSGVLPINTTPRPAPKFWADAVGQFFVVEWTSADGLVNFNDIGAAVQRFQNVATAPPFTWVDMHPEVPNQLVNFADINNIVGGFIGLNYPYTPPGGCP